MQCPYCISDIPDQALACPQCARDLYLFRPLLQGMAALQGRVAAQQQTIAALEDRFTALETSRAAGQSPPGVAEATIGTAATTGTAATAGTTAGAAAGAPAQAASGDVAGTPEPAPAVRRLPPANPLGALIPCVVVPIALLLAAHWLMLFIYDVKPLYLRIVTLVLPIPFGVALASRYGVSLGLAAVFSAVIGALAVTSMLGITAIADRVAFLPQTVRDWRETIEYVFGIGLASLTGWLIVNGIRAATGLRHRAPPRVIVLAAKAFKTNDKGEMAVELLAKRIQKIVNTATPAVSGAVAFYAGLKGVLGD